jgi:Domain of unknown function (DUF6431)
MILVDHSFSSLEDYRQRSMKFEVSRPEVCQGCTRQDCFWKHGSYLRHASDGDECVDVRIQRFICRYADCRLIVSCLFSFLVPYRRYTAGLVGQAIEEYVEEGEPVEARKSYRRIADERGGSRMSVFRWTDLLSRRAKMLQYQIQKEHIMRGGSHQDGFQGKICSGRTNAKMAFSVEKRERLESLSLAIAMARQFLLVVTFALAELHAYFLKMSESRQLIFCGRAIKQQTHHKAGRVF